MSAAAGMVLAGPPIVFEENRGQASHEVLFLSRGAGYGVFLTSNRTLIATNDAKLVQIGLAGAKEVKPVGVDRLPAKSNYFIGSDPARWHTGVTNYARVRYAEVYPGIDVFWHGRDGQIEHDFTVGPGADPRRIRFSIRGANLELSTEGDLIAGNVRLHKPHAYQDGREVACRYELRGRTVRFALGEYDRKRALTIDPVLSFSTLLGGGYTDAAGRIALDSAGNIYVAGTTTSTNFPVSPGAIQKTAAEGFCGGFTPIPCENLFVAKFTNDGGTLLFSTYLGGSGDSSFAGMALDAAGSVYLSGYPGSTDFPKLTALPGYNLDPSGPFVAKLSADGTSLIYATLLPLSRPDNSLAGMAVDAAGAVYLTGSCISGLPVVNAFQGEHKAAAIFKTSDSGASWQGLMDGLPVDLVSTITVNPTTPQTLYLGMDHGLHKSTDSGVHWAPINQGLPSQNLYPMSLAVDPSHPQAVYLGTLLNGVYKSNDGGASWTPAGTGASRFVRMIAIDPKNTKTLYAATDAGLYKTTDSAATWNPTGLMAGPLDVFFVHNVVLDPGNPSTLYAGTPNGVMKSIDAGATWTAMNSGFSQITEINALVIDPANPQTLYAVPNGPNVAPYRTSDGGAHWTQGKWPDGPYAICLLVDPLVHSTIWAGTNEGVLVSHDSGATWSATRTPLPLNDVDGLAGGTDGTMYAITNAWALSDAFAMKLDPTGSKILYSTYLGGLGSDLGQAIAVDNAARAYILGQTDSFDFPIAKALQPRAAGRKDAFVSVLDPTGAHLMWSTYLGGSSDDWPTAIALDPAGNIHIAGWTNSSDFPLRQKTQLHYGGNTDGFAAKLKGDGSGIIFSTYLGGGALDIASAVAADTAGNTYVAGVTFSPDFPTANAIQTSLAGSANGFVEVWNGQTGAVRYSTYFGGGGSDEASAIVADAAGNAYVAGAASSPDFPRKYAFQYAFGACPGAGSPCSTEDAFVAKIALQGTGPSIALSAVTDAAGYRTVVSPGEIVSIFG